MESSNMKHAPGPWTVCRDNPVIVRDADGTLIADCDNFAYTDDGEIQLEDCDANARLIAAAPELADLCEMVARLNPTAGEIGAGMLANMVEKARNIMVQIEGRKESK